MTVKNIKESTYYALTRFWYTVYAGFAALGLVLFGGLMFGLAGQRVEQMIAPVFVDFNILAQGYDKNKKAYYIYPEIKKVRNCQFLSIDWYAGEDINKNFRNVKLTYLHPNQDIVLKRFSRPKGQQTIGLWKLEYLRASDRMHFGIVNHDCGMPWVTRKKVGPFPINIYETIDL